MMRLYKARQEAKTMKELAFRSNVLVSICLFTVFSRDNKQIDCWAQLYRPSFSSKQQTNQHKSKNLNKLFKGVTNAVNCKDCGGWVYIQQTIAYLILQSVVSNTAFYEVLGSFGF
jgi:hypothetical protein